MQDVKVGDTIVMTEKANRIYTCSKEGSTGVVTYVEEVHPRARRMGEDSPNIFVQFSKLTGESYPVPVNWPIDSRYVRVIVSEKDMLDIKDKILSKVKLI